MKRILLAVLSAVCLSFVSMAGDTPPAADAKSPNVRVRFVPDKAGAKGAWGTHLGQPPGAMVHIGVGDTFPVKDKDDRKVFELSMVEGNDDHVVLEVKTKDATQKIDIKRDKSERVEVAGVKYAILYPSVSVTSTGTPTTNRVMLVVSTVP